MKVNSCLFDIVRMIDTLTQLLNSRFNHLNLIPKSRKALKIMFRIFSWSCCVHWTNGERKKFSWGWISFSGIWWSFAFGVRSLWRHNSTSCSCF